MLSHCDPTNSLRFRTMRKVHVVIVAAMIVAGCSRGGSNSGRAVLQNKGSDTLVNVAQAWAEAYAEVDANVVVAVTGGGSGTGISAMINGTVDIANSSRRMKEQELAAARKNGIEPVEHLVGHDALAIFIHPNNPLAELTLDQVQQVYAEGGTVTKWSQLGVTVPGCDSDEIVLVSRQNNSGTYEYFREAALAGNDFKLGSRDMHGSKDVADLVEKTPCAIGYSGLAYVNDKIKLPCLKADEGAPCIAPSMQTASDGSYSIARPLLMYTRGEPEGAVKAYLDWILSDRGQCIIRDKGYSPINKVTCA